MSRSYRKQPFMAICGSHSAKKDKTQAHRGERQRHKQTLCAALSNDELEDYTLPLRLECRWNNVYSWTRDGRQRWQGLTKKHWYKYLVGTGQAPVSTDHDYYELHHNRDKKWPPAWFKKMMRK